MERKNQTDFKLIANIPWKVYFTLGQDEEDYAEAVHWMAKKEWLVPYQTLPLSKTGKRYQPFPFALNELGKMAQRSVRALKSGIRLKDYVPPRKILSPWTTHYLVNPLAEPWENWITNGHLACKLDMPKEKNVDIEDFPLKFDSIYESFQTGSVHQNVMGGPPLNAIPFAVQIPIRDRPKTDSVIFFHELSPGQQILKNGISLNYFLWFQKQYGSNVNWKLNPHSTIAGVYDAYELIGIVMAPFESEIEILEKLR